MLDETFPAANEPIAAIDAPIIPTEIFSFKSIILDLALCSSNLPFKLLKLLKNRFERSFIMISIDKDVFNLLNDAPYHSAIKIFLYIALNQPDEGVHGLRITKEQLANSLNLKRSVIFRDLKWLKDNLLLQEIKFISDFDYMANPRFVMNNSDLDERIKEWNRRCRIDIQHEIELKHKRRLKAARKSKSN